VKLITLSFICFAAFAILSHAEEGPTGIYGTVYNNNNQPAGSDFDTIFIINRYDDSDTASYYYNSITSYYVTNDVYGLEDGTWRLQGKVTVGGTTYWSQWYVVSWDFPDYVQQHIYCNSTVRPSWNPNK
jgi:hypothetical protein